MTSPPQGIPPSPVVPFPHDVNEAHPVDALAPDVTVEKVGQDAFSVGVGNGSPVVNHGLSGDDALAHLPVGSKIATGQEGPTKIMLSVPENEHRGPIASFGHNFHEALSHLWGWISRESEVVKREL